MRSSFIVLALGAAATVSAAALERRQYPACVGTCIAQSAGSVGCSTADASCLCNSQPFIQTVAQCFGTTCDAADSAAGVALGQQLCATIGVQITIPAAASSALAGTAAGSSTAAVASAASSGSSAGSSIAQSVTSAASSSAAAASSAPAAAGSSAAATGAASALTGNTALAGLALVGAVMAAL